MYVPYANNTDSNFTMSINDTTIALGITNNHKIDSTDLQSLWRVMFYSEEYRDGERAAKDHHLEYYNATSCSSL